MINAAPTFTSGSLPDFDEATVPYAQSVAVRAAAPHSFTFAVTTGQRLALFDLSPNAGTGAVTGTPTTGRHLRLHR